MEIKETKTIEMLPEENKCWQNKREHKFIHSITRKGLPLYINYETNEDERVEEENKTKAIEEFNKEYIQVNI